MILNWRSGCIRPRGLGGRRRHGERGHYAGADGEELARKLTLALGAVFAAFLLAPRTERIFRHRLAKLPRHDVFARSNSNINSSVVDCRAKCRAAAAAAAVDLRSNPYRHEGDTGCTRGRGGRRASRVTLENINP
jgi:hypothetical protein